MKQKDSQSQDPAPQAAQAYRRIFGNDPTPDQLQAWLQAARWSYV